MAIKVKRKQSRHQAAKEPDQIYTFSEQAFNALERNKKYVLGGLGAVLVLIIVITVIAQSASSSSRAAGAEVSSAVLLAGSRIGEAAEEGETAFETTEARAEAVQTAIADNIGDDPPAAAARLLDAAASVRLGDLTRARSDYEAVVAGDSDSLLSLVARQGLAATQASAGDRAEAESSLDALNTAMPALEHYVMLEKARLAEAAGDLVAALASYETVAASAGLVITETGVSTANEGLVATAEHRASVISVLLGRDEAPDEPETPEVPEANDEAPEGSETE